MGFKKDGATTIIKVDYGQEIDTINAQLANQDAQTATLLHGLSAITTDRATPADVKMYGRTIVNLLGKVGNSEKTGINSLVNITESLDSTNKQYGSNSLKITASGTTSVEHYSPIGAKQWDVKSNTNYLIGAYLKPNAGKAKIRVIVYDSSLNVLQDISSTIVTDSSKFSYSHIKVNTGTNGAKISIRIQVLDSNGNTTFIPATTAENVNFDGVSLYEIPQFIYDKIDVDAAYTGDSLVDKFPYIDSVQHVMNPYVKNSGKNLIPPFTSGKWTQATSAFNFTDDYSTIEQATSSSQYIEYDLECFPNVQYTFSIQYSDAYYQITTLDKSGNILSVNFSSTLKSVIPYTFTTDSNAKSIRIRLHNGGLGAGTFTFNEPQLELGSTATPFERQNESYLYVAQDADKNPISLASNNDGSVADEVYKRDGQWNRLNRFVRNMVLDGSLGWNFSTDHTGYKETKFPLNGVSSNNYTLTTKYDGLVLQSGVGLGVTDNAVYVLSNMYVNVTDTDSGWGETYTPSASEIKAYFYGWKMNNGTIGTAYGGTGTKTWVPIGDTDNTRATTILPTTDAPTIAEGKIDHYKLTYQLGNATEEAIDVEGSLDLINRGNQLQVGEAVIVREKVNFVKGTGTNTNTTYYANYNQITDPTYAVPSGSQFDFATNQIISVYKNGEITNDAKVVNSVNAQGGQGLSLTSSLYDQTAEYTVTYIALDIYKLSPAENNVEVTYNTNIKTVVDAIVQKQEDDETDISVLKIQMIDALARLTALGG
jgi:hypothetical protein